MDKAHPITEYRLTEHAKLEMARRQISEAEVSQVLSNPEQTETVREGHAVYQPELRWVNHRKSTCSVSL